MKHEKYGLIGEKLGHSFSKIIHEQLCPYTYDLIELKKDEVDAFLRKREFAAINVTIPYKETVIPYLTYIDPAAKAIGAVNTIVNRSGLLYGYNTDFAGIEFMLDRHGFDLKNKKVLILGSGGTCKTSSAVAKHRGCREMHIVSRTPREGFITYEQAYAEHADAEVLFNTTPVGMYPNLDASPIDLTRFPKLTAVVDVIYNPLKTALLQQADALGIPNCNGLEMLVAQAKYAAEHFLGTQLPASAIGTVHAQLSADRKNIALIGMPSCGKSTVGQMLAQETGKKFVDVDELIVKLAGKSIPEIFAEGGEVHFRAIEKEALRSVAGKNGLVIATGGGIIKDEDNVRLLRHNGVLFFLDRPLEKLVQSDPSRPLSSSPEAVKALYEQRLPLYRKYADHIIPNDGEPAAAVKAIKEGFYETTGA